MNKAFISDEYYSDLSFESLGGGIDICISTEHRFGTDAFLLADFAAPRRKDLVCDYCSGSGIIALLMIRNFQPSYTAAVELQSKAAYQIELTKRKCSAAIDIFNCDLKDYCSVRELDLITCNPPYKLCSTGIVSANEAAAIARHEITCDIDSICKSAYRNLKYGGRLCLCNRPERLCDIMTAMRQNKIEPKRIRMVAKDPKSAPWLILIEGKKGGKPFLKVEPPLFTDNGRGGYSDEMKRIYRMEEEHL